MQSLSIFSATKWESPSTLGQSYINRIDSLFFVGGKRAHVVRIENNSLVETCFVEEAVPLFKKILKIGLLILLSFSLVILPIYIARLCVWSQYSFKILDAVDAEDFFSSLPTGQKTDSEHRVKGISKQDFEIPEKILEKLNLVVEEMFEGNPRVPKEHPEVTWVSKVVHKAFKINGIPDYIFEMPGIGAGRPFDETEDSYKTLVKAKKIYFAKNLSQIPLPRAKLHKTEHGNIPVIIKEKQNPYLVTQWLCEFETGEGESQYYHKLEEKMPEFADEMKEMKAEGPFNGISILWVDQNVQAGEWKVV